MHVHARRLLVLCCLVAFAAAGCGGDDVRDAGAAGLTETSAGDAETPAPSQQTAEEPRDTGGDFCSALTGVRHRFDLLDISIGTDWAQTVTAMAEGERELATVEAPSELAGDWADVTGFFALVVGNFEGVDLADDDAVQVVLEDQFGPETEAAAGTAQEAIGRIDVYADQNCSEDGSADPAVVGDDGCALLDMDELTSRVFTTTEPTATPRTYGVGYVECVWTDGRSEVSLMMIPLEEFQREYADKSTPITDVPLEDLEDGLPYRGTIGIGRFSTRGHSVSFTAGIHGGFVSVRVGKDGSQPVDVGEAARLARTLVTGL